MTFKRSLHSPLGNCTEHTVTDDGVGKMHSASKGLKALDDRSDVKSGEEPLFLLDISEQFDAAPFKLAKNEWAYDLTSVSVSPSC